MNGTTVGEPLIEAQSLTKHYGKTIALHEVDMQVREGITGLLGPNGAGKSTAMKLFLGLLRPTAGVATVLGEKPYEDVAIRMRLGYMPEHDCLPDFLTASEFLSHMAQVSGIPPKHARTRAADMLRHVGLDEERYRHIKEYSTGMKQRVKLAQALVHDPVMVLLDEPTAGLDPAGREEMLELVRRTGKQFGINIMLSSHLMGDVESTCDRIIVIEGGSIVEQGDVSEFTQETETFYVDVDDRREEVIAALQSRGISATINGASLVVRLHGDDQLDDVRDALVETQARLRRLAPIRGKPLGYLPEERGVSQAQGEIYDLGYQHYDGPRGGRIQAVRSLWVNSFRTTLGLGRGARAKILPVLMSLFVVAPPAVFLVLAAVVPVTAQVSHADFYEATAILLLLFSAIIAPELLIPDRRSGVTTLYLVRPLTAFDYVAARWSAFLCVTLAVTLIGQVLVLAGNLLLAEKPGEFLRENWLDIPSFILAGVIITVFVTTIPMAVAAFTDRRAYAAAFVIALFVITTPMSGLLTAERCESTVIYTVHDGEVVTERGENECGRLTGDYAKWFVLLDVGRAPTHLSDLMFDDDTQDEASILVAELPLAVPIGWYGLLVVGPGALLLLRYWRMKI